MTTIPGARGLSSLPQRLREMFRGDGGPSVLTRVATASKPILWPKSNVPQLQRGPDGLDRFSYDDQVVRMFVLAMYVWGMVAFAGGLFVALLLVLPTLAETFLANGWERTGGFINWLLGIPYFTFGRIRPLHTNAAIFAFAGNAVFACVYYSTQRLCKARMWSDTLSRLNFWGWQLIIVLAAITLPLGITQGKEYAELEWPIDILIAVVWLGFFGGNFFMTLIKRRERHLYVALWFYIATIVTVTVLHVFNNLVVPTGLFKSYPIYAGVQDAMMQWWYGHNAVAFFLTTPFLGLMYYFMPKAAERPVFSYRLSIIHFWSLVFIYIWAGPHHLHYTSVPEWASSLGMVFSVMLWMPSWGGGINGLLTLRGAWHKVTTDPVLKFFVVGVTFYMMSTFEGPLLSVKAVNALSHYTDWTIAHVHAGALGWNGFLAFGMMYWLLPRLFQTPGNKLFSVKLANLHFWLGTAGILLYVIPIYVAGLTQGLMWQALNANGNLVYPDFVETVQTIIPHYWLRAGGGVLYLTGAAIGGYNFYKTWKMRPEKYDEPIIAAAPLKDDYTADEVAPPLPKGTMTPSGKRIYRWASMWWHRKWERLPVKFTVLVVVAIGSASLLELVPSFVIRSNVPTLPQVEPYTALELHGRDVYLQEGCYNCHSQMIRPLIAETKRYGEYSKAGEHVYDHPFQWGSRRIGPDLAREGGKQSSLWHALHFENPQQVTPGSLMPPYKHLLTSEIDFDSISLRMRAMRLVGVPYTDEQIADSEQHAIDQAAAIAAEIQAQGGPAGLEDKDVTALIAYLQRLGTDINRTPDSPSAFDSIVNPTTADVTEEVARD
ncbi:MAG: cytochrome-c oxidase, cbb3-type subunit I [Planctomycetota bacterium]